ncbi:MAG TPA: DinB family protein [Chloroflexia bacterium]|nr:DinB family protein [Chloroflexia bacterium]
MEPLISSVAAFIAYFESIRRRTLQFVAQVPPERMDWAPRAGEFTCGDIVRHLAAGEAMFVGAVVDGRWLYRGHDTGPADLAGAVAALAAGHAAALDRLRTLPDAALAEHRPSLDGPPIRAWRLLMAMVEHEIHHRSQLAMYLMLLGVQPPHIYGLGVEDVIARATG